MADQPPTSEQLFTPFPAVDAAAWRERVSAELGVEGMSALAGKTRGDLEIRPLYTREDAPAEPPPPGVAPYVRGARPGGGWRVGRTVSDADPGAAGRAVRRDVAHGAGMLRLALAAGGGDGIRVRTGAELASLLDGVDLAEVAIVLDAGADTPGTAALLDDAMRRLEIDLESLSGGFAADPLSVLARRGALAPELGAAFSELAELLRWSRARAPGLRAIQISGIPFHEAGASAVEELALTLAAGVETLRRLSAAGLGVAETAPRCFFSLAVGVGGDLFAEIAKLRAARLLWAKVVYAAGGDAAAQALHLHAHTSWSTLSTRGAWTNQLRIGVETFAAAVGGADVIFTGRWDELADPSGDAGARLALATQHLLAEEAHLGRVADPGGGSWYLESLTDRMAREAWKQFRELEGRGGLAAGLLDGHVAAVLARRAAERRAAVAHRREPLIGVSAFANPAEPPPAARPAEETRPPGALPRLRWSEPFERMRARGERVTELSGSRPPVALLGLGSHAEHQGEIGFAFRVLAAGGVAASQHEGLVTVVEARRAFEGSGAAAAILCAPPDRCRELLPELVPALRDAGARRVIVVSDRGLEETGADAVLDEDRDVLEFLDALIGDLEGGP